MRSPEGCLPHLASEGWSNRYDIEAIISPSARHFGTSVRLKLLFDIKDRIFTLFHIFLAKILKLRGLCGILVYHCDKSQ